MKPAEMNVRPVGTWAGGSAWLWVVVLAAFILNCWFLEYQPTVWLDEISYSDAAVNWVRGSGFVSSAWYAQGTEAFWSGNVPLHQVLLAGWLKVFGISEAAVRSLGYLEGCLAAGLFIWAGLRLALFSNRFWMIMALLLLLLADGCSFTYRSGRSDALTMLVASLQMLAFTLPRNRLRSSLLVLTAFLAPWAGLPLVVYLALVWMAAVCLTKGKLFWDAATVAMGIVAGMGGLVVLYLSQGTLGDFWRSIRRHTAVAASGEWPWREWLGSAFVDRSAAFLLLAGLVFLGWGLWQQRKDIWRPALGSILVILFLPLAMKAAGTYKLYYTWMTIVPAVLFLVLSIQSSGNRGVRAVAVGLVVAAISVGLPMRLFFSVLADPLPLKREAIELVARELRLDDRVISQSKFYYPVRLKAAQAYFPSYLERISPAERAAVTIMILDPEFGPWPEQERKEDWREVARLSAPDYVEWPTFLREMLEKYTAREINVPWDVVIYRRKGSGS